MRPAVFKALDEYNRKQADFAAWCKRRKIAMDGWITLSNRNGAGDKVGGARVLLDDDGAIVYGLGGGFKGKKLNDAFASIKADKSQGYLFSEVKRERNSKEARQARKEKVATQKAEQRKSALQALEKEDARREKLRERSRQETSEPITKEIEKFKAELAEKSQKEVWTEYSAAAREVERNEDAAKRYSQDMNRYKTEMESPIPENAGSDRIKTISDRRDYYVESERSYLWAKRKADLAAEKYKLARARLQEMQRGERREQSARAKQAKSVAQLRGDKRANAIASYVEEQTKGISQYRDGTFKGYPVYRYPNAGGNHKVAIIRAMGGSTEAKNYTFEDLGGMGVAVIPKNLDTLDAKKYAN